MDQMAADIATLARGAFGDGSFGGRFGLNGMIFYQEGIDAETLRTKSLEIEKLAADSLGIRISIGSSCYPFLNFDRSDVFDNCRKALDHALLLPDPRIAVFDSISLNLSADRRSWTATSSGPLKNSSSPCSTTKTISSPATLSASATPSSDDSKMPATSSRKSSPSTRKISSHSTISAGQTIGSEISPKRRPPIANASRPNPDTSTHSCGSVPSRKTKTISRKPPRSTKSR